MRKVFFESSSKVSCEALGRPWAIPDHRILINHVLNRRHHFELCQFNLVPLGCNYPVTEIAVSVARDGGLQSYVSSNGPSWLASQLCGDAVNAGC
ncbi:unnamed protein product [Brassica napus]|uniref:(rape) hypothetical protein n=1 Tax=Brassica napus TaxID=3708 RepID=A0A817B1U3_BRANA|nr:unnamed protein product [Brassica napus]